MSARHDVLFYVPNVGPLLLPGDDLPAGGAETQMVVLARELARRGMRVAFVVYADELPPSVDGLDLIVQRSPRIRVPGLRSVEAALRTLIAVVRGNASVVVQRNASVVTGLVALAARVTGRRFVYSSANVIDFEFARLESSRLKIALFHLGIRLANEVVVQTLEQVRLAREHFGVSVRLIRSVAESATPRSRAPRAFLWIGRLATYKYPDAYLDLAAAVPEATFRMVGVPSGPDGTRLAAEVAERARSLDNVELVEPRPRAALGPLYDEAVAVVNTAEFEGMPNIFLEGWARGVPALALQHDPDGVIVRERLGRFAAGDLVLLAHQARSLWEDREGQAETAERCVAYVRREHSLDAAARAWTEVIRGFADETGGAG
jgi:glycosyltransferase involved in cell wall biosynthesis